MKSAQPYLRHFREGGSYAGMTMERAGLKTTEDVQIPASKRGTGLKISVSCVADGA
jgi:hypothetical protein